MERREFLRGTATLTAAALTISIPEVAMAALRPTNEEAIPVADPTIYPISYNALIERAKIRHDSLWKAMHNKAEALNINSVFLDKNVPELHVLIVQIMREHMNTARKQGMTTRLIVDKRNMVKNKYGWSSNILMQVRAQANEIFVRMSALPEKGKPDGDLIMGYFSKSKLGKPNIPCFLPRAEVSEIGNHAYWRA